MAKAKRKAKQVKKADGRGRRNKWPTHVKPRLETIKAWRRKGLTEQEICKGLDVAVCTFATYKNKYPELVEALSISKADADGQVENALFKRAVGYTFEETETHVTQRGDGTEKIVRVKKTLKHVEPNTTAMMAYLLNRVSKDWQNKSRHELSGPDGGPIQTGGVLLVLPDNGRDEKNADGSLKTDD